MLEIDQARGEVPERVGLARDLSRDVSFADVDLRALKGRILARPDGALQATADGGFVHTAAVSSPEAFGPYTGRGPLGDGDFWSHTVMGDEVRIQLRYLGQASDTEGGSSGSPVVNEAGEVVGQLSGGCGTHVSDNCDAVNNATVDGAFAAHFDEVAPFLDAGGACTPVAEVCGDDIDNDCDGQVDENCDGLPQTGLLRLILVVACAL